MPSARGVPVTVVTGFLGAGKTTLVNHWLGQVPRGHVAVIVNEHGAVGIDGELLAGRVRTLIEITGGCICCTTQVELVRALDAIATSSAAPQRILIETSGAASPAGVLRAIAAGGTSGAFTLDGVLTVVDAARVDRIVAYELALEQIGYADVVVLSRADACEREVLEHAAAVVATNNGAAVLVEAARGATRAGSLEAILALRREAMREPRAVPVPSHHVYESVSLVVEGELDGERFADFMETELAGCAGRIFRTKGILAIAGLEARMIVQGVADSVEIDFGAPWLAAPRRSRLVVVGFGLDRAALGRGFAACAVG